MNSSRLPGKALLNLKGKPMLQHIIEFTKYSRLTDEIIIATSDKSEDDQIQKLAEKSNISCFRGSSDNVLKRYYDCALKFGGEIIIRLTGDNPLIDPTIIDQVIDICKKTKCDYCSNMINQTFPLGYLVEGMTFQTLKKMYETKQDELSKEHVTHYLRKNLNEFFVKEVHAPHNINKNQWRLSVDYKEDFELIQKIFDELYQDNSFIPYEKVVGLLDKEKYLLKINENRY